MDPVTGILKEIGKLTVAERTRLLDELRGGGTSSLSVTSAAPRPHSVAWLKAEKGHAVLDTGTSGPIGLPAGPRALFGMWSGGDAENSE